MMWNFTTPVHRDKEEIGETDAPQEAKAADAALVCVCVSMCRMSGPGGMPLNVTRPSFQAIAQAHLPGRRTTQMESNSLWRRGVTYINPDTCLSSNVLTRRADMRTNQKSASVFDTRNLDEWFCNVVDALRIHKDFFFLHRSDSRTAHPASGNFTSCKDKKAGRGGGAAAGTHYEYQSSSLGKKESRQEKEEPRKIRHNFQICSDVIY